MNKPNIKLKYKHISNTKYSYIIIPNTQYASMYTLIAQYKRTCTSNIYLRARMLQTNTLIRVRMLQGLKTYMN